MPELQGFGMEQEWFTLATTAVETVADDRATKAKRVAGMQSQLVGAAG